MQVNNDANLPSWLHTNVFLISHTNNREKYDLLVTGLAFPNLAVAMETDGFYLAEPGLTLNHLNFALLNKHKSWVILDQIFSKSFFNVCINIAATSQLW